MEKERANFLTYLNKHGVIDRLDTGLMKLYAMTCKPKQGIYYLCHHLTNDVDEQYEMKVKELAEAEHNINVLEEQVQLLR